MARIRTLYKTDIPQVLAIEESDHVVPWTEETFKACFQAGYLGWVAEEDKKIIGFVIISLTVDECHVLNLCIARDYQRQGWGQKLLEEALQHAKKSGIGVAYLEVRRSNTRAITLYNKLRFHIVGERKDYYPTVSGQEDALIFAKLLINLDAAQR